MSAPQVEHPRFAESSNDDEMFAAAPELQRIPNFWIKLHQSREPRANLP